MRSKYFPEKIKVPQKSTPSWQLFIPSLKRKKPKDSRSPHSHPSGGLSGTPHSDICYPSGGLWGYSLLGGWPIFKKRPNSLSLPNVISLRLHNQFHALGHGTNKVLWCDVSLDSLDAFLLEIFKAIIIMLDLSQSFLCLWPDILLWIEVWAVPCIP